MRLVVYGGYEGLDRQLGRLHIKCLIINLTYVFTRKDFKCMTKPHSHNENNENEVSSISKLAG